MYLTQSPPTQCGWYWIRGSILAEDTADTLYIVPIIQTDRGLEVWVPHMDFSDPLATFLDNHPGLQWVGPIVPPRAFI